jgi:hypothetical protein
MCGTSHMMSESCASCTWQFSKVGGLGTGAALYRYGDLSIRQRVVQSMYSVLEPVKSADSYLHP